MIDALMGSNGTGERREQPSDATGKGMDEMGQETFLKLMITQFQNQDPFQPMESGEFLGQLAHFSTATGISDLQQSFETFAASMATDQGLRAAGLVGRSVLVESGHGYLPPEGELQGAVKVPTGVEQVTVKIYDEGGTLVRELPLGSQESGQVPFAWDGTDEGGNALPPGRYQVSAEALRDGKTSGLDVLASATVNSVTLGQNGESPLLSLEGLGDRKLSAVRHIQ